MRRNRVSDSIYRPHSPYFNWCGGSKKSYLLSLIVGTKAAVELNNGRAAQMGILALMVHEKLNNDPYIINSLLGYPVPFNQ